MSTGTTSLALRSVGAGLRPFFALRWVRVLAVLALVALVLRASLNALLARTLRSVTADYELTIHWDELDLSLLGGEGTLRGLRIESLESKATSESDAASAAASRPLIEIEYGTFDLAVSSLLAGKLRVRRAEVDGIDARLERDADGVWNFERHLALALQPSSAVVTDDAAPVKQSNEEAPIDLSLPIAIEALRLQQARLLVRDLALGEPLELSFELNAGLSNFNLSSSPARYSITVTGGDVLDGALVDGELRATAKELGVTLRAQAGGLRAHKLAPYLALLDIRPAAQSIEANCRLEATVQVTGEQNEALVAHASLSDVMLVADGGERLSLKEIELGADYVSASRAEFAALEIRGPHSQVELLADGALRIAGFDYVPGLSARARRARDVTTATAPTEEKRAANATLPASAASEESIEQAWSFAGVRIDGGSLLVQDHSTTPTTALALEIESIELGRIAYVPGQAQGGVPLHMKLRAPGVAEEIAIDGELQPIGPDRNFELALELRGMGLEAIDPYLARAGVARDSAPGSLRLNFKGHSQTDASGRTLAEFEVAELLLGGSRELFGLKSVHLSDFVIDPNERLVRVGNLEIQGTRVLLERDMTNNFVGFGLRLLGRGAIAQAESAPTRPAVGGEPANTRQSDPQTAQPVRIEIGRLAWEGSHLAFLDKRSDPPTDIELDEIGFELLNLSLGGAEGDQEGAPATFAARLKAQGIVESLSFEGNIRSKPGPFHLDANFRLLGEELSGQRIAQYMNLLGIEPLLREGRVELELGTSIAQLEDGLHVDLEVRHALLADSGKPLLALEALQVSQLVLGDEGLKLGRLSIAGPRAWVRRDELGVLEVAGLRFAIPESAEEPAVVAKSELILDRQVAQPAPLTAPQLPAMLIDELNLADLTLVLDDAANDEHLALELVLDFTAHSISTRGVPGTFDLSAALRDHVDELSIRGDVLLSEESLQLSGQLASHGIRAGSLANFLPASVQLECEEGELRANFAAQLANAEEGGLSGSFEVSDASWGKPEGDLWFALGLARFEVLRVDPVAREVLLGAMRVEGTQLSARRDADGVLHALGLKLGGAAHAVQNTDTLDDAPPEAEALETSRVAIEASATLGSSAKRTDSASTTELEAAVAQKSPPFSVRLDQGVLLELERFEFIDEALGELAQPMAGRVQFTLAPAQVLHPTPTDLPPLKWKAEGALAGLVRQWELSGTLAPFAPDPAVSAEFRAEGVRTAGVGEWLPALAESLRGEIEEGTLSATFDAQLHVRRARPFELGLERAFSGEASLKDLYYRAAPDGEILAGVDAVQIELKSVDLQKSFARLESIEVSTPRLRATKDASGVHALGFVIPAESPDEVVVEQIPGPTAQAEAASADTTSGEPNSPSSDAVAGFEVSIDRFTIEGLDVLVEDTSVSPPVVVPLDTLDFELRRFSTRGFSEARPMPFNVFLASSAARSLRHRWRFARCRASSPDQGVSSSTWLDAIWDLDTTLRWVRGSVPRGSPSVTQAPSARTKDATSPVFEELVASGRVSLYPAPNGYALLQLSGLELARFAGLTEAQGITVEDGALDTHLRLDLRGQDGLSMNTELVFTDLGLREPEGGFLQSALSLPIALDSALFLLRNPSGEHRIAMEVDMGAAGISVGRILVSATTAIAEVLGVAIAGAPLRVLTAFVPEGNSDEAQTIESHRAAFDAGNSRLGARERAALLDVSKRLAGRTDMVARLTHELGAMDLLEAERLANPSEEDCLELTLHLRQRRHELTRHIEERQLEARALYAIGASEATVASADLRSLQSELAGVESSLDQVLDVIRSNSARQRQKRTRVVARELALLRLEEVAGTLRSGLRGYDVARIEIGPVRIREAQTDGASRVLIELLRE